MTERMKPKILILNIQGEKTYGGSVITVKEIIDGLKGRYGITYVGYDYGYKGCKHLYPFSKLFDAFPMPVKKIFLKLCRRSAIARKLFIRHPNLNADIVFSNSRIDDIFLVDGNVDYRAFSFVKHGPNLIFKRLYPNRLIANRPHRAIMLNYADYSRAIKRYGKQNAVLIHTGITTKSYKIDRKYLERLSIKPTDKVLVSTGRLVDEQKGFSYVIKALSTIKRKDVKYFIIGEGKDAAIYRSLIKIKGLTGGVFLTGFLDERRKYSLLKRADLFLQPSSKETLGLTMIEALRAGTPVLASKTEGSADVIINGKNGFLLPGRDKITDELVNGILKALAINHAYKLKLRKNATKSSKSFSVKRMQKEYLNTMNSLLNEVRK